MELTRVLWALLSLLPLMKHVAIASRPVIVNMVEPTVKEPSTREALDGPWFCHSLDCPKFSSDDLGDGLEKRSYDAGRWASTNITGVSYDTAVTTGFMRLFEYISGANEHGWKIEMTAPVLTKLTPGEGPFCEDYFTVSFFLPFEYQDGGGKQPPAPNRASVFIESRHAGSFYVLSYAGFTRESRVLQKAQELITRLDEGGHAYDASAAFYAAGYDPPFRLVKRHNEIWIPSA